MEKMMEITEDSIKLLVDNFYKKVRADNELGPVFNAAIGDTSEDWRPHLQQMYDFWSSIALATGRYHGYPMVKHKMLPPFDIKLFDRWLKLFAETANEIHPSEIADKFIDKSHRIAANLKWGIYQAVK